MYVRTGAYTKLRVLILKYGKHCAYSKVIYLDTYCLDVDHLGDAYKTRDDEDTSCHLR